MNKYIQIKETDSNATRNVEPQYKRKEKSPLKETVRPVKNHSKVYAERRSLKADLKPITQAILTD